MKCPWRGTTFSDWERVQHIFRKPAAEEQEAIYDGLEKERPQSGDDMIVLVDAKDDDPANGSGAARRTDDPLIGWPRFFRRSNGRHRSAHR
jgi:hypothetical protein